MSHARENLIVLVVEDEDDHWTIIERAWRVSRCRVARLERARTCQEMIVCIAEGGDAIGWVLLDGMLPDGNGYEMIEQIRTAAPGVVIVGMSLTCQDDAGQLNQSIAKEYRALTDFFRGLPSE